MIGAQRAAAQRRRQANELIREFSFFMHFINANCAQLTWQKERDRDRDRERSGKLQRQCQRYKSKSSSRNCSANKYYAAGAKGAARGYEGDGEAWPAAVCCCYCCAFILSNFRIVQIEIKICICKCEGNGKAWGRGGDECSVTACICEIRDKKSLAAAYLPSCAAKLAKRTAKMQITIKMRLTLFLVLLLLLFSLCVVVIVFLFVVS